MSAVYLILSLSIAVLVSSAGWPHAHATLVAYYNFDGPLGNADGLSGYCPNIANPGQLRSATSVVTSSSCFFGNCLSPVNGGMALKGFKVFRGVTSAKYLSVSFWLSFAQEPVVGRGYYFIYQPSLVYTYYVTPWLLCGMVFSTQGGLTVALNITLPAGVNHHIACMYDGEKVCLHVNNTLATSCSGGLSDMSFSEGNTDLEVGSVAVDPNYHFNGTIDELKIYDHALTPAQLAALSSATAANDQPAAHFDVFDGSNNTRLDSSYSLQAYTDVTMSATVEDGRKAFSGLPQPNGYAKSFTYSWQALTQTCGGVTVLNPSAPSTQVSFDAVGPSTLKVCVSDGEIAREVTLSITATASQPEVLRQPAPVITIPEGAKDFAISVEGRSVPPPSYQWQMLVNVTVNQTTENNVTARGLFHHDARLLPHMLLAAPDGRWMAARELVQVEKFESIPGAAFSTLLLNGTQDWDGMIIRCLVFTSAASIATDNFTVVIGSALTPAPAPGSGSSSDAALIGGIVGGVGGAILLCAVLLILLAVLLLISSRRRKDASRKLHQPDFLAIAFSDVKDDVQLPKKQIEEYKALEQLVASPDHRLALAICNVAFMSERDTTYRSLLRVLMGQAQAYNFVARAISLEVASADEEGTLFRANSASAKLFTQYMRMIALKYLWHVLVLSIHALNDNAREAHAGRTSRIGDHHGSYSSHIFGQKYRMTRDDFDDEESVSMDVLGVSSMELDPQRLDEAADLDINTLELWLTAQKMLKLIMNSEKSLPQELRLIIRRIHDEVEGKFSEEAVYRAMGGFFFLRLICPALLAPQSHGLIEEAPHPMAQRQLILVTKVLQNLANDTLPGAKEAYMEKLNAFIVSNKPALARFYDQIVDHPAQGSLAVHEVPQRARNDALLKLRTFLEDNLKAVEANLRESEDGEEVISELRHILHADRG